MKIFLAARYGRQAEMRCVRHALRAAGHEVTSRWLDEGAADNPGGSSAAPPDLRERIAVSDLEDLAAADAVVSFTEVPSAAASRGGRHVEFGYALALGKRVLVVGPRENVFHYHPRVEVVGDFDTLLKVLGPVPPAPAYGDAFSRLYGLVRSVDPRAVCGVSEKPDNTSFLVYLSDSLYLARVPRAWEGYPVNVVVIGPLTLA